MYIYIYTHILSGNQTLQWIIHYLLNYFPVQKHLLMITGG